MSWRSTLRRWLPLAIADAIARRRPSQEELVVTRYLEGGRIPWSAGYGAYRSRCITSTLDDPELMRRFRQTETLPRGFGHGLDERCVEYPWVLSRLAGLSGRLLDAGSSLNHAFLLDRLDLARWQIQIVTLAPEANCFWQRGIGYLYEDLRRLPLRGGSCDAVVCISTLEHVGFDNRFFTGRPAVTTDRGVDDHPGAMGELGRVLRPGGTLLLTVPFGRPSTFPAFCQYDLARLDRAVSGCGGAREVERAFYRYTADGWNVADAAGCQECAYVEWLSQQPADRAPEFPVQPDNAAAARAVACLRIVKQ